LLTYRSVSETLKESRVVKSAHLVCFRIGKETFGVDIFAVREIVRVPEITTVPGAPDFVLGVINLRGGIISVVDLGRQLGFSNTEITSSSRILVIHLDGVSVGFLVDTATSVIKVGSDAIDPPPEMIGGIKADYLEGVAKLEERLAILLNLRKVLTVGQAAAVAATSSPVTEPVEAKASS
jgi:purine-binding chemotaxis protein CheW